MKRTVISYGGNRYTIANEDVASVQARITEGLRNEPWMWLEVNHGDGRATPARLLVSPATPVAVIRERDADEEDDHSSVARHLLPDELRPVSVEMGPADS
ncbi:hypothetical protein [Curtobacterium sp. MCBD17_008]|uniref:hypothetical protein n=1 Tax=Curtobacterium sp. MCBD17_008 TaxID=2175656 RepID=UPI000DA9D399|nr:hypothetical protein [Curtobacterium sp. MCBD17_008]PZE88656.1 hypothetical protein DEI95_14940 [Curtobacterium sp. MCBD17_008]